MDPRIGPRARGVIAFSIRGAASAGCTGKLQGSLQMIFDLRQCLARELLEVRVGTILDLLSEQRRISLLILDLTVHIVPVECGAMVRVERGNHRVIGAAQERIRWSDIFALQDRVERATTGIWLVTIRCA
jgi:hypothetical protein